MVSSHTVFTLGFRAYTIAIGIVAVFTGLLTFDFIAVSPTAFGWMWIGLAALGGVIVLGLTVNTDEVIETDRSEERCQRWEECLFTGWLLNIYLIAAAIWAGVSFGWFIGGQSAAGIPVVGYGWLAVAGYGALVTVGMLATHAGDVVAALHPTTDVEA